MPKSFVENFGANSARHGDFHRISIAKIFANFQDV